MLSLIDLSSERHRVIVAACTQWQESEASIQYCILRELKPRRVIEIGSGTSTRFAAYAMTQNAQEGYPGFLQVGHLCLYFAISLS
jgi:hypothetical protein